MVLLSKPTQWASDAESVIAADQPVAENLLPQGHAFDSRWEVDIASNEGPAQYRDITTVVISVSIVIDSGWWRTTLI